MPILALPLSATGYLIAAIPLRYRFPFCEALRQTRFRKRLHRPGQRRNAAELQCVVRRVIDDVLPCIAGDP